MTGNKALRRFMQLVAQAPEGADFEVGTVYDPRKGWRVYQRIGSAGLAMSGDAVRSLLRTYEAQAAKPQWHLAADDLRPMFDAMRLLADEVDQKNRDKVLPPDMPNFVNAAGRA